MPSENLNGQAAKRPPQVEKINLNEWFAELGQTRSMTEQGRLMSAFKLAEQACLGEQRESGEAAINHVFTVAELLTALHMDTDTLVAAMLHEAVEKEKLSLESVEKQFGNPVAKLIEGVLKITFIDELNVLSDADVQSADEKAKQAEQLRRMILVMVEDVRVMLIRLAERLHNMRMLKYFPPVQQYRIARETLDIFAPLANRLGIWQFKWELEDLSLRYLEPETYKQIAGRLNDKRVEREAHIEKMMTLARNTLDSAGIVGEVMGRPKHIYSIWNKTQRKGMKVHELYDTLAIRILVSTVQECYIALGLIHGQCPPIHGEFDDYIASPKNNDYSSLHTAVLGPEQRTFEVQIRTHEMHEHSELGVASHWRYKEGVAGKVDTNDQFERKIAWMRQILAWKEEEGNAANFIERFKSELLEERVYVTTPKGKVLDLPMGATPLDFAYHIHTELGHSCRGAKVNDRMVKLNYPLTSGEQIHIINGKHARPSRQWLDESLGYIKTLRARHRIKAWFNQRDNTQHIGEGRSLLNRELHRLNVPDFDLTQLAIQLGFNDLEQCLIALGSGNLETAQVAEAAQEHILPTVLSNPRAHGGHTIIIQDNVGLRSCLAKCCKPVPDEPAIGYLTSKGVIVHRLDCEKVKRWQAERQRCLVRVAWGNLTDKLYPVDIHIRANDRFGLLRDVSSILTNAKINIIATHTLTDHEAVANMILRLEVKSAGQLSQSLKNIEDLTNVLEVLRLSAQSHTLKQLLNTNPVNE